MQPPINMHTRISGAGISIMRSGGWRGSMGMFPVQDRKPPVHMSVLPFLNGNSFLRLRSSLLQNRALNKVVVFGGYKPAFGTQFDNNSFQIHLSINPIKAHQYPSKVSPPVERATPPLSRVYVEMEASSDPWFPHISCPVTALDRSRDR